MNTRDRILARPELNDMRAARDLDGLAAALNANPPLERRECWVDALGILNRCPNGKSIIRKLKAGSSMDAVIETAWTSLVMGKGLDFGADSTVESIDEMAATLGFTDVELTEMKNLPMQPVVVTRDDVNGALFNSDGTLK